jgi:gas vesicle protein
MRTFWYFLGGAAVGAGAALLYAPTTGARARSMIRDKFTKYTNDIGDAATSKARHLKNVATGWQHKVGKMVEHASDLMHDMADGPLEPSAHA